MNQSWKQWIVSTAEKVLSGTHSPLPVKEAAWQALRFAMRCGRANPISFALRPLMTHHRLRTGVGIYLALGMIVAGIMGPLPSFADDAGGTLTINTAVEPVITLSTQEAVHMPLTSYRLTQRYWLLHSGLDMASEVGQPIKPVMNGTVIKAEQSWFGYGNMVIVEHPNGYQTLYAHMSKIKAAEGEKVSTDTVIGEVGSTGRSTGPHLHLEVYQEGKTINPAPLLGL